MYTTRYETHNMPHPLLPLIFHCCFEVTQRNKYPNRHENSELLRAMDGSGYVICGAKQLPLNLICCTEARRLIEEGTRISAATAISSCPSKEEFKTMLLSNKSIRKLRWRTRRTQ